MNKHPVLGWPPPKFGLDEWHEELEETLAHGLPSVARQFVAAASKNPTLGLTGVRVAVLRTFSLELSESLLSLAFMQWQRLPQFCWFDFGTFEAELLDPSSRLRALHHEQPLDFILLAWRLKDWLPETWSNPTADACAATVPTSLTRIRAILDAAGAIAPVIAFPFNDHPADAPLPGGRASQESLIIAHHSAVLSWCAEHPQRSAMIEPSGPIGLDRKAEAFAHQPYSRPGQVRVSTAIARACAPWLKAPAKVLVLDADDTLWGGILGEDGVAGVHIGQAFPGNLYWELQQRAKYLRDSGILLGLVSKNDEAAVTEMFAARPDMPLRWTDFSSRVVNWEDKVTGLRRVAQELNLALDSFVFLDDSPFERALVRAGLPQVRVPETADILTMLDYLESGVDFLMGVTTREDSTRAADYAAQESRDQLQASAPSLEAFLHDLQLVAVIESWSRESLPRIAQMLQKTNQFNLTTRRHTLSQLGAWLGEAHGRWEGWTLHARDRFADQGLVGCLLARAIEEGEWEIDSFLLSCRALGRGFETALLSCGLHRLRMLGAASVIGHYIPTDRNGQVRTFYPQHGAHLISTTAQDPDCPGTISYRFDLTDVSRMVEAPAWIRLEDETRR